MGTFWHVLKPNKSTETPSRFIFYDTETKTVSEEGEEPSVVLHLGVAIYVDRVNGVRTVFRFEHEKEFWDFVESKAYQKTKIYIFAHNQHFDFNVLHGFNILCERNWTLKFIVFSSGFIAVFRKERRTLVFLDSFNFFHVDVKTLGRDFGVPKLKMPKRGKEKLFKYCERDVEIVEKAILSLVDFIRNHDLGNMKYTIAGLAMNAFRHRFMKTPIVIHADPEVTELERNSYRGGRNLVYFLGTMPPRRYAKLDVNSGYPYVMANNMYPVKLLKYFSSGNLKTLSRYLHDGAKCVIAEVLIHVDRDAIGKRVGKKLMFPTGTFWVTLTTRELRYVLKHGEILDVGRMAIYDAKPIFTDFVKYFYDLKRSFEKEGNVTGRTFAKLFMNSLSGKWGQRNQKVVKLQNSNIKPGYEIIYDLDAQAWARYFTFANTTWKYLSEKEESPDSFPAIGAHITADMRLYIAQVTYLLQDAGYDVFYSDTDSIITTWTGYRYLEKKHAHLIGTRLGQFKLEKTARKLIIYAPKDYVFGTQIKLKGIRKNALKISETEFMQDQFPSTKQILKKGKIIIRKITKKLTRNYEKGQIVPISPDVNEVFPFVLNESF